jgi:hypothetical protein
MHPPQELKTRVRIPPGYKDMGENVAMLPCFIDLICIVCVLKREIVKALAKKMFLQHFSAKIGSSF